jgi:hypothetical protein
MPIGFLVLSGISALESGRVYKDYTWDARLFRC